MSPYPVALSLVGATPAADDKPGKWQLRDPGRFLRELFQLIPCQPGLFVALVRDAGGKQRLEAVVPVHWQPGDDHTLPALEEDHDECTELLRRAALKLWGRRSQSRRRPEHVFVSVVVRRGRVVYGPLEAAVMDSWRFTNHCLPVLYGELALVTEHGWLSGFDDSFGATPALALGDGG
jgi:hypothetical protein